MKNVNVFFEDEEHEALSRVKGSRSWREFVLTLVPSQSKEVGAEGSGTGVGSALIEDHKKKEGWE